eukprot:jgi/Psemu1/34195/gm1.34195_g
MVWDRAPEILQTTTKPLQIDHAKPFQINHAKPLDHGKALLLLPLCLLLQQNHLNPVAMICTN